MSKVFKVLSIDGGGALGIYPATILEQIEEHLQTIGKVQSAFDLMVGTSTGGLIALSLSAGNSPKEIVQLYENQSSTIFPNNIFYPLRYLNGLFGRSVYSGKPLKYTLKRHFGDKKIKDLRIPVCIPAVDSFSCTPVVFKTNTAKHLTRDLEYNLVDIALATSSAPFYFPTHKFDQFRSLVDGGIWQNNPSMIGLIEANAFILQEQPKYDSINVLSIGNPLSNERSGYLNRCNFSSILSWRHKLITVPMKVTSNGVHNQMEILARTKCMNLFKYLRVATNNKAKDKVKLSLNSSSRKAIEVTKMQALNDFNSFKNELISFFN